MFRSKLGRGFAFTLIMAVAAACSSPTPRYKFSTANAEIVSGAESTVDLTLTSLATGKAVADAVIFETRFDMEPDNMGSMTASAVAQPSPQPGVYRFVVSATMPGRWAFKLKARVQGETDAVIDSVILTAK